MENVYSQNVVIIMATAVAVLDILFILLFMPESLPEKMRPTSSSWESHISWEKADPFGVSDFNVDDILLLTGFWYQ